MVLETQPIFRKTVCFSFWHIGAKISKFIDVLQAKFGVEKQDPVQSTSLGSTCRMLELLAQLWHGSHCTHVRSLPVSTWTENC